MPSFVPLGPRTRVAAALVAATACTAAAVAGVAACLTAPPADIGTSTSARPEIVHDAVQPPGGLLSQWPLDDEFVVPVRLADPTGQCVWRSFDQDLEASTTTLLTDRPCVTSLLDGG